jgi:putative membrane protein
METLLSWVVKALLILVTAYLIPGFHVSTFMGALVLAIVVSIFNFIIKPVLLLLTLPINILTLGLFTLIVNAIVLQLAIRFVPGVSSASFGTTLVASIVMGLLALFVGKK